MKTEWTLRDEAQRRILQTVLTERNFQDSRHGGPNHDDSHGRRDWAAFITIYLGRSLEDDLNPRRYRDLMTKVAALAVAAIERSERTGK